MQNVVTGCSGFIGGHLVRALLNLGESVCVVDKESSDQIDELAKAYPGQLDIIWSDLTHKSVCERAVDGASVVYHLAAETNLGKSVQFPGVALLDDLLTTIGILEACTKAKSPPRVVIASSAAVYGKYAPVPVGEKDVNQARPRSPYAIHKRACEMYADMYHHIHSLSVACLRYFNVYGPGQMNLQAVIPSFTLAILRDQPAPVRGDGRQSRDFVHVNDIVNATLWASSKGLVGQWNVGTGVSVSLLELILELEKVTGKTFTPRYESALSWDIHHSRADISSIQEAGWSPQVDLASGLKDTVEYYQQFA